MILAEKIMTLRKKSGWSQEELAEQHGISRLSVSKWESGVSIPDLDKIIKMSFPRKYTVYPWKKPIVAKQQRKA